MMPSFSWPAAGLFQPFPHIMMKGRIHSIESFGTVDGPGIRFVTFMMGCPLRCLFCHNPDTWNLQGKCQYELTPEELCEEAMRYYNFIKKGGVTLSGGEPLMQAAFALSYFRLCKDKGLHTALDTSGYFCTPKAMEVLDYTDLVLLDIKTMNPTLYPRLTGVQQDNNLRFLDILQEKGIKTWVRHVVVPGLTDDEEWLHKLGRHLQQYNVVEKLEILPYHTMGVYKYQELGIPYPLEGTPDMAPERAKAIKAMMAQYVKVQ